MIVDKFSKTKKFTNFATENVFRLSTRFVPEVVGHAVLVVAEVAGAAPQHLVPPEQVDLVLARGCRLPAAHRAP